MIAKQPGELFDLDAIRKHAQHRTALEREIAFHAPTAKRAADLTATAVQWQARAVHAGVVGLILSAPPCDRRQMVIDVNAFLEPFGLVLIPSGRVLYDVVDVKTGEVL